MTTDFPSAPSAYGLNGPSAAITVEKSIHALYTETLTPPERQILVVKAAPAGLVLRDQLRLKCAVAVTGSLDGQFAELHLQGLLALAVAGVASGTIYRLILAVTEVIGHLRRQRPLDQQLGELFEQPILANQIFWFPVISQQAVQQLLRYCFLSYGHHRSWQRGSFLPSDRLHKNSYTLPLHAHIVQCYPQAEVIRVVLDNLNTHKPASLYEAFLPEDARAIARKLEFH